MLMALAISAWVAQSLTANSSSGLSRWQADVANGSLQLNLPVKDRLLAQWCQRDASLLASWLGDEKTLYCPTSKWSQIKGLLPSQTPTTDPESALRRWKSELVDRERAIRKQLASVGSTDLSTTVLSELALPPDAASEDMNDQLSLERQAADDWLKQLELARERVTAWDKWQVQNLAPLLKSNDTSKESGLLLLKAARSLDGQGNDTAAQMVRRFTSAGLNASRASQLLSLSEQLPALLALHWALSLALMLVLRWHAPATHKVSAGILLLFMTWWALYFLDSAPNPLHAQAWLIGGCSVIALNWVWRTFHPQSQPAAQSLRPISVWVLPAWWLFSALGFLLVLDQSMNFHPRNRFLALEQWQAWWISALLMPVCALSAQTLARLMLWLGAWGFQPMGLVRAAIRLGLGLLLVGAMWVLHRVGIHQHITGEFLKLGFCLALSAWCVWRFAAVSELWHAHRRTQALTQALPSLLVFVIAAAISTVTQDKGPLLVICMMMVVLYSSMVGWTTGIGLIVFGFLLIFLIGVDLDVVGSRLQAWKDPFTADHDDMAKLKWFQASAAETLWGFGPGRTPWCGTISLDQCRGLPLQLQSDYTFTALVGWVGIALALGLLLLFSLFGFHLLAQGARMSQQHMKPLAMLDPRHRALAMRSHLLFFSGVMLLLQAWITAAGNTGLLPLTGLTWPLLSYGKASLWLSTWLIFSWGIGEHDA
jgi:cell division protein FtsW (lipid II flippase)